MPKISNIQEVLASISNPIVFAMVNGKADRKIRSLRCEDTGIVFASNGTEECFSPITGGKVTVVSNEEVSLDDSDLAELVETNTCECGLAHYSTAAGAKMGMEEAYCLACGSPTTSLAAADDEDEEVESEEEDTSEQEEAADKEDDEDVDSSEEEDDEDDADWDKDWEDDDDDESADSSEDEEAAAKDDEDDSSEDEPADDGDYEEDEEEDAAVKGKTASKEEEKTDDKSEKTEESSIVLNFYELERAAIEQGNFSLVAESDNADKYVFCSGIPVAKMVFEKASDTIRSNWKSTKFAEMFLASLKAKEDTAQFGFEPIKATINTTKVVANLVAEKLAKETKSFDDEKAAYNERMNQALAVAYTGIAKRSFKSVADPLRKAFVEELSRVGIRNPESIVSRAYKNGMEELLKAGFNKALDLVKESDDTRSAMAKMVEEANFIDDTNSVVESALIESAKKGGVVDIAETVTASKEEKPDSGVNKYRSMLHTIQARRTRA